MLYTAPCVSFPHIIKPNFVRQLLAQNPDSQLENPLPLRHRFCFARLTRTYSGKITCWFSFKPFFSNFCFQRIKRRYSITLPSFCQSPFSLFFVFSQLFTNYSYFVKCYSSLPCKSHHFKQIVLPFFAISDKIMENSQNTIDKRCRLWYHIITLYTHTQIHTDQKGILR